MTEIGYRMHAMHDADSVDESQAARDILASVMEPQFPVEAEMARKGLHFMLPASWAAVAVQRALDTAAVSTTERLLGERM